MHSNIIVFKSSPDCPYFMTEDDIFDNMHGVANRYQYKYLRVNNYIPNPALHFFCTAYKNFVEQVKACEFGEEWLKFRGFIAPDPPAKKKNSKKTKTKTKKEVKKND